MPALEGNVSAVVVNEADHTLNLMTAKGVQVYPVGRSFEEVNTWFDFVEAIPALNLYVLNEMHTGSGFTLGMQVWLCAKTGREWLVDTGGDGAGEAPQFSPDGSRIAVYEKGVLIEPSVFVFDVLHEGDDAQGVEFKFSGFYSFDNEDWWIEELIWAGNDSLIAKLIAGGWVDLDCDAAAQPECHIRYQQFYLD